MIPGAMPLTEKYGGSKTQNRLQKSREVASASLQNGFIPNAEYNALKTDLNRAIEEAFREGLNRHYLQIRHNAPTPDQFGFETTKGKEAYYATPMVHNLAGAYAKFAPHASGNQYLTEWTTMLKEWLPWGQVMADLKNKIAKRGDQRLQPAQPKATTVNPDQIRATCACCFRSQAVVRGGRGMAHHGYQRPGLGYQTKSCMGVSYQPYELSNAGTKAIHQVLLNMIDAATQDLQKIESGKYPLIARNKQEVKPGAPEYRWLQETLANSTKYEIKTLNRERAALEQKISGWNFTPIAGLNNG
jgi:hypothetical protein